MAVVGSVKGANGRCILIEVELLACTVRKTRIALELEFHPVYFDEVSLSGPSSRLRCKFLGSTGTAKTASSPG